MKANPETKSGAVVVWRRRFWGMSLILAICALQWGLFFWMLPRWLAYNTLGMLGAPGILVPGLLANWFVIGHFIAVGGSASERFLNGLLGSLFLAFILVAAALSHLNRLPPTYMGP